MRQIRHLAAVVALCLGLAACFTSTEPLIGGDEADFPFTRLVFEVDDRSGEPQLLIREGDVYRMSEADGAGEASAYVRLRSLGNGVFAAQFAVVDQEDDGSPAPLLYALLVAGEGGAGFASYAAIRPDDFQAVPGLVPCGRDVCVSDLDAYVDYAMARVRHGEPDVIYRILERN